MKRLIAAIVAVSTLLCLVGCKKDEYTPVESTAEEKKTVVTFADGGETYEAPYELYRTLFYTYKSEFDGGDNSVWQGEGSKILIDAIQKRIFTQMTEIYSAFALCKKIGYDLYSKDVEEKIRDCIKISVEGGLLDGEKIKGYDGDYDAYLASLAEMHTNYSVQVLMFRYMIAKNAISEHYSKDSSNIPEVTREELYTFYQKEDTLRVLRLFLPSEIYSKDRADEIAASLRELEGEEAVARAMIGYTTLAGPEVENGILVTPYNLDSLLYQELTETAFSLTLGEVSDPLYTTNAGNDGYFILYRTEKSDAHFDRSYSSIVLEYIEDEIGRSTAEIAEAFRASIVMSDYLKSLDHANLK